MEDSQIAEFLPDVWFMVRGQTAAVHTAELQKEIAPEHPLYDRRGHLVVIAKCSANDDVIVADTSDPEQFFCVHLTWARHPEAAGYPITRALRRSELKAFFADYGL